MRIMFEGKLNSQYNFQCDNYIGVFCKITTHIYRSSKWELLQKYTLYVNILAINTPEMYLYNATVFPAINTPEMCLYKEEISLTNKKYRLMIPFGNKISWYAILFNTENIWHVNRLRYKSPHCYFLYFIFLDFL